jgi:site-specific DNA-methyltransferase (adenine-specific)/modification methylase
MRKETIGDCTLYCGDCREILPEIRGVDAVITDPPYGIGCSGEFKSMAVNHKSIWRDARPRGYPDKEWDKTIFKEIDVLLNVGRKQIIFGGNYYRLPLTGGWLVWDKKVAMPTLSKCELAWTSFLRHTEILHYLWSGFRKEHPEERFHPTQKPEAVMRWCVSFLGEAEQVVLDPFMGSGTTGVACVNSGRRFIGVELNEGYFEIACRRVETAYQQEQR